MPVVCQNTWASSGPVAATGSLFYNSEPSPGQAAIGRFNADPAGIIPTNTLTVGSKTYTFVIAAPGANEIELGASNTLTADNIVTRVGLDTADTLCTGENQSAAGNCNVKFTANALGTGGNGIPLSCSVLSGSVIPFADGTDANILTVGGEVYTYVSGTPGAGEIQVGNGLTQLGHDTADIINADTATTLCTAVFVDQDSPIDLTANTPGATGNSIPLSTTYGDTTIVGFHGGLD